MQTGMHRNRIDRLAIAFLIDKVGIEAETVADLLATSFHDVRGILAGDGAKTPEIRRRIDAIAATQSLLLSGYTPDTAARWMRDQPITSDGRTSAAVLRECSPDALGIVLHAAYARMSS